MRKVGLTNLRKKLDAIDEDILQALARRRELVTQVIRAKDQSLDGFRDRERESALLCERLERGRSLGLESSFVTNLFRQILDHSNRVQRDLLTHGEESKANSEPLLVGFQGKEGAYSSEAARRHFSGRGREMNLKGYRTFREMLEGVTRGTLDFALLPLENTIAGSVHEAYDLINELPISVVGEEVLPIEHCLISLEEIPLAHIRKIYSHPVAIAQCSNFLTSLPDCAVEAYVDTAMSVDLVRQTRDSSLAAIASEDAARIHGLRVLRRDIANQRENYTRFVAISRNPVSYDERICCKTSLILATKHEQGALLQCLNVFSQHELNLTKLESRPRPNVPWEYLFYIDFEGNLASPEVKRAMQALTRDVSYLRVLGSYPTFTTEAGKPVRPKKQIGKKLAVPPPLDEASDPEVSAEIAKKKGYTLASRAHQRRDTTVRVGEVTIGGSSFSVMAGPCSVESREQVAACAQVVRENGGHVLRGGVFKPRTSTYSFQGLEYEGLEYLWKAGKENELPIVTEVMQPNDVLKVAEKTDMIQIGARNMQNFALLKEVGRLDRPVLLKRGPMASIDEFLAASEYLLAAGNQQVVLCERGIRTFETSTRFTLDLSAVLVLKERSHLPVLIDPSHAAGNWRYVGPLARAAKSIGAHGIMVEIHPDPARALSDGPQALTFENFALLMQELR